MNQITGVEYANACTNCIAIIMEPTPLTWPLSGLENVCSLFLRVLKLLIIKKFEKRIVSEVFKLCCVVEKLENALVKHVLTLPLRFKKCRGSKRFFDSKVGYHISNVNLLISSP